MKPSFVVNPCPFCGSVLPFRYISISCVVMECSCGATMKDGAARIYYSKYEDIPEELEDYAYEPTGQEGWCISASAALWHAGILDKWNRRVKC